MFTWDVPLDATHCRRCGAPLSQAGTAGAMGCDLCTRCSSRVETLAARTAAVDDHAVVDGFRTYQEDFND